MGFLLTDLSEQYNKNTIAGWDLEVECNDFTTSCTYLRESKIDNNLNMDLYAVDNHIAEDT